MSQIDVNIIEPIPYLNIMEVIGLKGEKGDKGEPGEVTQSEFDELSGQYEKTQEIVSGLSSILLDVEPFEISTDGSTYANTLLVQKGAAYGAIYMRGVFNLAPSLYTDESPGTISLQLSQSNVVSVTLPYSEGTMSFINRYVSPNVIENNVIVTLTTNNLPKPITKTANLRFVRMLHYGVAASGTLTDTFLLQTLSGHSLRENKSISFNVTAGANDYVWFALPETYGTPKFTVGGFSGGFTSQGSFIHTNSTHTITARTSYVLWKSDNKGLGNVTVVVS